MVIVEEHKQLVILSLVFIVNFVPVVFFAQKSSLSDLLLETFGAWHMVPQEIKENMGVQEWRNALDLLHVAIWGRHIN